MELLEEIGDFTRNVFEGLERDVEEMFPPVPGGLVDSARAEARKRAYAQEQQAQKDDTDQPLRNKPYFRTETLAAPIGGANTVIIPNTASNVDIVLSFDPHRKRAVIMTLDEPVVLSTSQAQAGDSRNASNAAGMGAGGFVLPINVPFVTESASEVWAAATSATATRISVWTETFGS